MKEQEESNNKLFVESGGASPKNNGCFLLIKYAKICPVIKQNRTTRWNQIK